MTKLNILVDTNSLAHLSAIADNVGNDSDKWLYDNFNVFRVKKIEQELKRNIRRKRAKSFRRATARNYTRKSEPLYCKQIDAIDSKIISLYYNKDLGEYDIGERHLIGTAVAAVRRGQFNYCIVLTDDYSAFTQFIEKLQHDIVFGDVWNVFDMILYLFLIKNNISLVSATQAIQTLISLSSISTKRIKVKNMSEEDARWEMLNFYVEKLKRISTLKAII